MNSPIPYHLQIKEVLKKEITTGKYKDKIPSERELIKRFSVSRTTIRESINHLVNEGYLQKIHGKGTFILKTKPVHEWIHTIKSLTETITRMGMKPGSKLLLSKLVNEPAYISDYLNLKEFHLIKRLRLADEEPIAIERHYHHPQLGKQLCQYDLNAITIYDVMEKELGVTMEEAEQSISCRPILKEDARELGITPDTNVLFVDRLIRNSVGEVIEYYTSVINPEMYVFRIKLKNERR